jgi:hypothetical protein
MTILKIIFVAMLCVPLLYISGVLAGKLMDEFITTKKKTR